MKIERRGVNNLQTMAGLRDARSRRTSAGALMELSMLAAEKGRLDAEIKRADDRCAELRGRIERIDKKSLRLFKFVEKPDTGIPIVEADPFPSYTMPESMVKKRILSY